MKPFIALYTERQDGDAELFLVFANRDAQTPADVDGTKVSLESQGEGVHVREFDFLREVPDLWDLKAEAAAIAEAERIKAERTPAPVTELGGTLQAETIAAIHQCLQILAGCCDHARRIDGAGFNKMDSEFGHSLAQAHRLSPKQAASGQKLIRKYHRQLPADILRAAIGSITAADLRQPDPSDTSDASDPADPADSPLSTLPSPVPHIGPDAVSESVVNTPAMLVNRKYGGKSGQEVARNGCEEWYGDTYQNGVQPGPKKLAQFVEVLQLAGTPKLYTQEDKGDEAIVHVKLFDPTGSWTWFITEFSETAPDGYPNLAFGLVHGADDELGYISLEELATVKGRMGIGIEIDMHFQPTTLAACRESLGVNA
jgi:hypothetical protein